MRFNSGGSFRAGGSLLEDDLLVQVLFFAGEGLDILEVEDPGGELVEGLGNRLVLGAANLSGLLDLVAGGFTVGTGLQEELR